MTNDDPYPHHQPPPMPAPPPPNQGPMPPQGPQGPAPQMPAPEQPPPHVWPQPQPPQASAPVPMAPPPAPNGTQRIETTTPIWRVVAVVLAAGAIAAIGLWVQDLEIAEEFATIAVITIGFTISFWARKRPDKLRARFGPFGKIANAARESIDDIQQWVYNRPLRVGALIAVGYGIIVVIAKTILIAVMQSLYSWYLTVAVGAIIASIVAAPHLWRDLINATKIKHQEPPQQHYSPPPNNWPQQ